MQAALARGSEALKELIASPSVIRLSVDTDVYAIC
jgi:hypothetical protein